MCERMLVKGFVNICRVGDAMWSRSGREGVKRLVRKELPRIAYAPKNFWLWVSRKAHARVI